jgi:hypothetical protein
MQTANPVLLLPLSALLVSACVFFAPDTAKITVTNGADYDVTGITFGYYHADEDSMQTRSIYLVEPGASRTITVELQKHAVMTMTSPVELVYYINGQKYDVNQEEGHGVDDTGKPYTHALIGGGHDEVFTIKNDRYTVLAWSQK